MSSTVVSDFVSKQCAEDLFFTFNTITNFLSLPENFRVEEILNFLDKLTFDCSLNSPFHMDELFDYLMIFNMDFDLGCGGQRLEFLIKKFGITEDVKRKQTLLIEICTYFWVSETYYKYSNNVALCSILYLFKKMVRPKEIISPFSIPANVRSCIVDLYLEITEIKLPCKLFPKREFSKWFDGFDVDEVDSRGPDLFLSIKGNLLSCVEITNLGRFVSDGRGNCLSIYDDRHVAKFIVSDGKCNLRQFLKELYVGRRMCDEFFITPRSILSYRENDVLFLGYTFEKYEKTLSDFLWNGYFKFDTNNSRIFVQKILRGLTFMHERGFVHGNLSVHTIVLVQEKDDFNVKIADFASSCRDGSHTEGAVSFPRYTPKERILDETISRVQDIWQVGCIYYELINGKPLFCSRTYEEQLENILIFEKEGQFIDEFHAKLMNAD